MITDFENLRNTYAEKKMRHRFKPFIWNFGFNPRKNAEQKFKECILKFNKVLDKELQDFIAEEFVNDNYLQSVYSYLELKTSLARLQLSGVLFEYKYILASTFFIGVLFEYKYILASTFFIGVLFECGLKKVFWDSSKWAPQASCKEN
ncbi:uncharacterized protein EV154DRAFT_556779 [Mucor mucedo]|uniref:uncharacterized protein n=1 Tax=Mucor mucedo TaxID=29922 RepID=UPI00221FC08C|nr:uncharacterized protein EV154DRAFT_556779 [Mucor mucedo]KAI7869272.1 hypothetical protein EV154DRAFT_556779 [Mucor mucedo]